MKPAPQPQPTVLPRSFLYVPADQPHLFPKAAIGPADALIFDLEDAVPLGRKELARQELRIWLTGRATPHAADSRPQPQYWVRINSASISTDLGAILTPSLHGIFLAKCSPEGLQQTSEALTALEQRNGIPPGRIGVIALVEDAAAIAHLDTMARCDRLVTFAVGEVDLMADLRMTRGEHSEPALDSLRLRIVLSCAAAGLAPPVAPTSTDIQARAGFEASSRKMHALGFRSRTAVHPSQLEIIHGVFTPSTEEVLEAQDIVDRFNQAQAGITLDAQGRMIDAAVVRGAEETLLREQARRAR